MATMAQWGSKKWVVSASKVMALEGLSFSYAQAAEENKSTEDKKTTNERGRELFTLSFTTTLHSGAGVDVRKEIESWESLVTKTDYFYLNGKRLGPKLQLRKVSANVDKVDDLGRMRLATLSFEFKEYEAPVKSSSSSTSASSAAASSADKQTKSTTNTTASTAPVQKFKKGQYVYILESAKRYSTGEKIPNYAKAKKHKIEQIRGGGTRMEALLGYPIGIRSWVYWKDLSLAPPTPQAVSVLDQKKLTY